MKRKRRKERYKRGKEVREKKEKERKASINPPVLIYRPLTHSAQIGFKIFLNTTPFITNWTSDGKQFSLVFEELPLADFVELPDDGRAQDELWYSNILCGVLRGALEMVQVQVEAHFISDVLRGNDTTEMRISLIRYIDDELPPEDD